MLTLVQNVLSMDCSNDDNIVPLLVDIHASLERGLELEIKWTKLALSLLA